MVRIEGTLLANAEPVMRPTGENLVVARVNPGPGFPYEVLVNFGSGESEALRARSFAATLRRGDRVVAQGDGSRPRTDHSYAAILLTGLVSIDKLL